MRNHKIKCSGFLSLHKLNIGAKVTKFRLLVPVKKNMRYYFFAMFAPHFKGRLNMECFLPLVRGSSQRYRCYYKGPAPITFFNYRAPTLKTWQQRRIG